MARLEAHFRQIQKNLHNFFKNRTSNIGLPQPKWTKSRAYRHEKDQNKWLSKALLMISQSSLLSPESGAARVENPPKFGAFGAHLWRAPLYYCTVVYIYCLLSTVVYMVRSARVYSGFIPHPARMTSIPAESRPKEFIFPGPSPTLLYSSSGAYM